MIYASDLFKLLISYQLIEKVLTDSPIIVATPYPFNASETSYIQCYSNEIGFVRSLSVITSVINSNMTLNNIKSFATNVSNNGSISLIIPSPFNYSSLTSNIQCTARYNRFPPKISELEIVSVAVIAEEDYLSIKSLAKEMVKIYCRAFGTDIVFHWQFTVNLAEDFSSSLPVGIQIQQQFTINDTLIIERVSYLDHQGYYRCLAMNQIFNRTYTDRRIIHLSVHTNNLWLPILIVSLLVGLSSVGLILCSRYCQTTKHRQTSEKQNSPAEPTSNLISSTMDQRLSPKQSFIRPLNEYHEEDLHENRYLQQDSFDKNDFNWKRIDPSNSFPTFISLPSVSTESSDSNSSNKRQPILRFILSHPFDNAPIQRLMINNTNITIMD